MKTGIILMTALLPTKGHKYLIEYASNFLDKQDSLEVIISSRTFEPIAGMTRYDAFTRQFNVYPGVDFHLHEDDNAPQNPPKFGPAALASFWSYWMDVVHDATAGAKVHYVFASEPYGSTLAEHLGAEFIPVDMSREIVPVKSTDVRKDSLRYFNRIMPEMQRNFRKTITFFGAESTGKTTWAKWAAKELNGYFLHEWARPYLETVGADLTVEKMSIIVKGQYAAQKAAKTFHDKAFIFHDTDLLSTIGYYHILGWEPPVELISKFKATQSDLYIVMDTDINFEPDQLRYGVDKRQSNTGFWLNLLHQYNCNFIVFQRSGNMENDKVKMDVVIKRHFYDSVQKIADFERE